MSEPVTIGERYRRATTTSNMRVRGEHSSDPADLLIAAGWADSLGIKLYRLAGEFDQVSQEMHRATTASETMMVLGKLKSLNTTRAALVSFAMDAAPRWGVILHDNIIAIVVGKVLSAWLDPMCPRCGGIGSLGGYDGEPKRICRRCGGTGKTRHGLGETDQERYVATRLLSSMDAKMAEADEQMKRYMRARA
jgi:hypothetical protein